MMHALKRWAVGMGLAAAVLPAAAPQADARAFTYSTKLQTIRVGVLLPNRFTYSDNSYDVTSTAEDVNHSFSYVFQALNARPDIRPYGWEIINPHAPPFMDEGMARRYGVSFNVNNPPKINKNMAVYWEVFLRTATTEDLADYDVLYMPFPLNDAGNDQLTVEDREKLRRAVDGGTILWVDNISGTAQAAPSGGKLFVQPSFSRIAGRAAQFGDPSEALLTNPYRLTGREVRQIGVNGLRTRVAEAMVDNRTDILDAWKPVLMTSGSSVTAGVFSYGQGAVVLTGGAIGRKLTRGFTGVPGSDDMASGKGYRARNTGPISGSNSQFISMADLKFMVNILAYRFQSPQPGAGPRHASGSRQDLDTPLGRKWQNVFPNGPQMQFASDPATWNGLVFSADQDGFLRAYDMDPERDIDGDGNTDDGLDDRRGSASDAIWAERLPGPVSSLVVGTVSGEAVVYGMTHEGSVFAARAMSFGNAGGRRRLLRTTSIKTTKVFGEYGPLFQLFYTRAANSGASSSFTTVPAEGGIYRIPAPVWYNGRLFVVGVQDNPAPNTGIGGVAEIEPDPSRLAVRWMFPRDTTDGSTPVPPASRMGIPSATPTVAAIPDKGYADATDILLLVPTLSVWPNDTNSGGVTQASRLMAFPIGVRGERVARRGIEQDGQEANLFLTRFANTNAIRVDESTVRLWAPDGSVTTGTPTIDRSRGFPRLGFTTPTLPVTDDIRADYDFLPGEPGDNFQGYNARWSFDAWSYVLGSTTRFMEILTSPVVSNDGGVYFVASDVGYGANQAPIIMGLEMRQQRVNFNIESNPNFLPPLNQPQLTFLYNVGGSSVSGSATDPAVPQPIVMGTPAVDRGVLVAAWGRWTTGGDSPQAVLAGTGGVSGFQVRNTRFGLLLQYPVDEKQKGSISVVQRNRFTGDFQQVGYGLFDVENVTVANSLRGLLIFRTLSSGPGTASLDLSRPGDIQVSYQALDITTGKTAGVSNETPVVYYRTSSNEGDNPAILSAFPDKTLPAGVGGIRTGVTLAGGSVYVGSDSGNVFSIPLATELERLEQMRGAAASKDMRPATFPPLASMLPAGGDPRGLILRSNPVVASNSLVQSAPVGMFTFYSPRTLITESDRILEVVSTYRANSNPLGVASGSAAVWSMDSTTQTRDFGRPGAGPGFEPWGDDDLDTPIQMGLKQPTMAIRVNTTNTVICDTGNNRVVEVDRTGRVQWQVTEFADPYGLLGANESRTLKSPTSVQRWESFDFVDDVPARTVHNLIADSGNNRVLEIVTRYSPDPNMMANNVVVWVGRGPAGTGYQFYQAHRLPYLPANANDDDYGSLDMGRTVATVTNLMVNGADAAVPDLPNAVTNRAATSGGSVVLLGGRRDGAANGRVVWFLNTMNYGTNPTVFPLARPVFFQASTTGTGPLDWSMLLTDGQNIYDLVPDPDTPGLGNIPINPAAGVFPIVANQNLGSIQNGAIGSGGYTTGIAMARRLANGNIMMVNQQTGQAFEFAAPLVTQPNVNPANLLLFLAPPLEGTTALSRPVYADRVY